MRKEREMKQEIIEIIRKSQMFVTGNGTQLRTDHSGKLTAADIELINANKPEIIAYLQAEEIEKQKREAAEREERYAPLIAQLPERKVENTPDAEKFSQLMERAKAVRFFDTRDEENEGLNLRAAATRSQIETEAQKYCAHNLETRMELTYTQDARLKVVRHLECRKCGLHLKDKVEEDVRQEAIWR